MKKVVSITIANSVFSIEEDAYSLLQKYLADIGKHFSGEDSLGEIIDDIEISIADKLIAKKRSLHKAATHSDIDEIITTLGTIQELTDDVSPIVENSDDKVPKIPKKFYRNGDEKVIAGVASGIADYFGLDSLLVRILFIIFMFISGFGIIIYIALWILVPVAKTAPQKLAMKGELADLEGITSYLKEKVSSKKEVKVDVKNVL